MSVIAQAVCSDSFSSALSSERQLVKEALCECGFQVTVIVNLNPLLRSLSKILCFYVFFFYIRKLYPE